jgi:hypothetical protein
MPSAVIRRYGYDPRHRALTVLFVTGRRYRYAEVPPEVYAEMRRTLAKGPFFNTRIRGHYAYEELEGDTWDPDDEGPPAEPPARSEAQRATA